MEIKEILYRLRNPHSYGAKEKWESRNAAADLIEKLEKENKKLKKTNQKEK